MSEKIKEFENHIIKKYRGPIWSKFIKAIKTFSLVNENDKILVAVSGGKDSLLLSKLFQELKKHPLVQFDFKCVVMDPGYTKENLELLKENMQLLGIEYTIEPYNIFKVVSKIAQDYPCYMCARMRRGFLYSLAEKYDCNKVALGHHYDDVIETTLINLFYSGSFKTMLPKLKSTNHQGLELIRPMYFIREKAVYNIMKHNDVHPLDCGCDVAAGEIASKRSEVKEIIKMLKKIHPDIDKSIFRAADNVNLDNILGWVSNGKRYKYHDDYE